MKEVYSATRPLDPIFSDQEWKEMYPAEEYRTCTDRAKEFVIHFLLGLNKSDKRIIGDIQKRAKGTLSHQLTRPDPKNHRLTPLHIAVMRGRFIVASELLATRQVKRAIDERDAYGWTALHHSVFSSKEIFRLLVENGANLRAKTALDGTVEDLQRIKAGVIEAKSLETLYYKEKGEIVSLASMTHEKALTCLGLIEYRDNPLITAECLKLFWQEQDEDQEAPSKCRFHAGLLKIVQKMKPVKLLLDSCEELPDAMELRALEDLPFKTMIGPYGGEYANEPLVLFPNSADKEELHETSDYFFVPFDALRRGNHTRFMNNGWPNLFGYKVIHNGQNFVYFIVIDKEGIKAGTPLLIDYGSDYTTLSLGTQRLLGKEAMKTFFEQGLKNILSKTKSLYDKLSTWIFSEEVYMDTFLKYQRIKTLLTTPLESPTALLYLHYTRIFTIDNWNILFNETDELDKWKEGNRNEFLLSQAIIKKVTALDLAINSNQKIQRTIYDGILEMIGQKPIMKIVKAIQLMTDEIVHKMPIDALFSNFDNLLEDYSWQEDPDYVMGEG